MTTRILLAEMRLPFPPSLNHYWRKDQNGMHISEEGKRYLSSIQQLVLLNGRGDTEFYLKAYRKSEPKLRLRVRTVFFLPDNRKRDLDNLFKVIFDCMTKTGIWTDDSQVFKLNAEKLLKRDYTKLRTKGRAELEVYGDFE